MEKNMEATIMGYIGLYTLYTYIYIYGYIAF